MNIFGKRRRWYLEKYVAFEAIVSEGNCVLSLFWTKSKQIITYLFILSGVSVGAEQGFKMEIFNQFPSWLGWLKIIAYFIFQKAIFILPLVPIIELVKDFGLGLWSRNSKLWQIRREWEARKGLNTWAMEQMKMMREIHGKTCPDSKIKHKGYVSEKKD